MTAVWVLLGVLAALLAALLGRRRSFQVLHLPL